LIEFASPRQLRRWAGEADSFYISVGSRINYGEATILKTVVADTAAAASNLIIRRLFASRTVLVKTQSMHEPEADLRAEEGDLDVN